MGKRQSGVQKPPKPFSPNSPAPADKRQLDLFEMKNPRVVIDPPNMVCGFGDDYERIFGHG